MPADAYTPTLARTLPGPSWLSDERAAAAERYADAELPTAGLEEWRYSRIDDFDTSRYALAESGGAEAVPTVDLGPAAARVVLVNGTAVSVEVSPEAAEAGVVVARAADRDERGPVEVPTLVGGNDAFGDLNEAFAPDPIIVTVPRNVTVAGPIQIISHIDSTGALVLPRVVVNVGENAEVELVEWSSSADVDALVIPRTSLAIGGAARVSYVSVNDLSTSANQFGGVVASVGQEASVRMEHIALGGDFARNRFDCRLVGRGASGRISALYLGDGNQMHDLRTFQSHEARDTSSDLLFKGAVDGSSHAVYTGLIHVGEAAAGTNANQTNRVITLSDDSWAESVPNLEIHHNDVRCSHATAVGPIDENQRFYLESRGVPPEVAERLVVNGFFADVLDSIGNQQVVDLVRPLIAERLGGVR